MYQLKLDIDNKDIGKWFKEVFEPTYRFLRQYDKLIIWVCYVYKTRKGYHIYLRCHEIKGKESIGYNEILLQECLFGSDRLKQLYGYGESRDILFSIKKEGQSRETTDRVNTAKLKEIVERINNGTSKAKHYKIQLSHGF
jgi:hypothetical protein